MSYNLTFLEQPGIFGIVKGLNIESNYWLATIILLSLYLILFISMKNYDTKTTLLVVPFLIVIVAGGFWGLGLIKISILRYFIILFITSVVIYLWWGK